jgi:hypothetical protein
MTDQDVLLERIEDLKKHILEQIELAKATNGRLRTAEKWIHTGRLVVAGLVAVVGWLYVLHIRP